MESACGPLAARRPPGSRRWAVVLAFGFVGCNPNSLRPPQLEPVRDAVRLEVRLPPDAATQELADQLVIDSIPATVVAPQDGYVETPWFEAATGRATGRRPLGPEVVRLRAWIDPGAPHHSHVVVELVYRPLADPSLPQRELDVQVPPDHPAGVRLQRAVDRIMARYGVTSG